LGGIETKRVIPDAMLITVSVFDADDNSPLPRFQVTPGRQRSPSSWTVWQRSSAVAGTNGSFALELPGKGGAIVFTVEAEGYLPIISEPLTSGQTNCVLRLKKGTGPKGIVKSTTGEPLAAVNICYIADRDQANLAPDGSILNSSAVAREQTDSEGRFSFAPKIGEGELIVACSNGFGRVSASVPEPIITVIIEPWARVHGRLVQNGKPVAQEKVDVKFDQDFRPGHPMLHLHGTVTDEDGRFSIERVPPGSLRLTTRVPVGSGGAWTSLVQKKFTAKPAEDVDLREVSMSRTQRD
jgi:hypothetical protein